MADRIDFKIDTGFDESFGFRSTFPEGEAPSPGDVEGEMGIRTSADAEPPSATLSTTDGTIELAAVQSVPDAIDISLTFPAALDLAPGRYVADIRATYGGEMRKWTKRGDVIVGQGVTR